MRKSNPERNARLVVVESTLTGTVLSVPIMTPFYLSIGLSQGQIAITQMACTATAMILNYPSGWLADCFGRKWANVIGDTLMGLSLLLYCTAQSFQFVVLCETLFGVGCAMSQGVDSTLLKHFSDRIDGTGELFKYKYAKMASYRQISTLILMLLGGPIGAISFRLAIASSSITYFTGAFVSLLIVDDSERLKPANNPLLQMKNIASRSLHNRKLRVRIIAFAISREITHGIIWVFTPMMLQVGVPLAVVSVGWAISYIVAYIGARLARHIALKMNDLQVFAIPLVLVSLASVIMYVRLNIFTLFFYACYGLAQGWTSATMMSIVKKHVEASEQSSVESLTRVVSQLLYIVAIWAIQRAAGIELRYALLATIAIFIPLAIPVAIKLHNELTE